MVHFRKTLAVVCLTVSCITIANLAGAVASPPPDEPRPLTDNETATLWSGDADSCLNTTERTSRSNERVLIEQLSNCTDITFNEPPRTAAAWTTHDFKELEGGSSDTSVHPPYAELTNSLAIRDAHATVFAVHPSTRLHATPDETPLYITSKGSVRGLVDYRVRSPATQTIDNRSIHWGVLDHEVRSVRLKIGDDVATSASGTQTPELEYTTTEAGRTTLTLEADIRVELRKRTIEEGNRTRTQTKRVVDDVTVSQTIPVVVYNPTTTVHYAEYPNGEDAIAVSQSSPWNGFSLSENENESVRGIWRYYTARGTDWDTLVRSTHEGRTTVESEARPVYVHAFPSKVGIQSDPAGSGPEILDVWGPERKSPARTIPKNVSVAVVEEPYTKSSGLAVRHDDIDRSAIRVQGIVRGVNATLVEADGGAERAIRESNLTIAVLERNASGATVRIKLRDEKTNDPIALSYPFESDPRFAPLGAQTRDGYITIGGKRIETNASGTAIVTVRETGIYTARYHPGTWRSHNPAYTSDTATVTWHPLTTLSGWVTLTIDVLWFSIPFVVALYAGLRLGSLLAIEEYP